MFGGTLPRTRALASANATYRSKIDSSLSIDSAIDTVSINANGAAGSLPFREGRRCWTTGSVWITLVVGASSVAGAVMTKLITFGAEMDGVEEEIAGLAWVGTQALTCVCVGAFAGVPSSISPSNFLRARWKLDCMSAWNEAASLRTFAISAATSTLMAVASVPAGGWYSGRPATFSFCALS